jgi:superfamily II RNA helicase
MRDVAAVLPEATVVDPLCLTATMDDAPGMDEVGTRWKPVAHTSILVAPASILTAAAAAGVPPCNAFDFAVSPAMEEWRAVVTTQRQGVSELKRAVKKAQKLVAKRSTLKRVGELHQQLEGARTKLKRLEESMGLGGPDNWQRFMQHVHVLTAYDALTEGSLALTPLGQVAAEVRGENELWLAAALRALGLDLDLEPPQLAAVVRICSVLSHPAAVDCEAYEPYEPCTAGVCAAVSRDS